MKPQIAKQNNIKLILSREAALIKEKGKIVPLRDEDKNIRWGKNDVMGLMGILGKFDTRIHKDLRGQQQWLKIRERVRDLLLNQSEKDGEDELALTPSEAGFLVGYLKDFSDKDGKDMPLQEFEIRARLNILAQLE